MYIDYFKRPPRYYIYKVLYETNLHSEITVITPFTSFSIITLEIENFKKLYQKFLIQLTFDNLNNRHATLIKVPWVQFCKILRENLTGKTVTTHSNSSFSFFSYQPTVSFFTLKWKTQSLFYLSMIQSRKTEKQFEFYIWFKYETYSHILTHETNIFYHFKIHQDFVSPIFGF